MKDPSYLSAYEDGTDRVFVCLCVFVFVFPHALSPKVSKGLRQSFVLFLLFLYINAGRIDCGPSMKFCLMGKSEKSFTFYIITNYGAESFR